MPKRPLRLIPLGGLGEIGKNMMALEYNRDIIVVDAGVLFPEEDIPGVDLVIPDISYLLQNRSRVRAIFITHGHEDHTGALPYVLRELNVPVYAPRLACGLISVKLKEHKLPHAARIEEVEPGKAIKVGAYRVEFFRVCHSIPDAMGLAINTPLGLVINTGDFKIDHTPAHGEPTDLAQLARLCAPGVFLLLSDSTYAEVPGYTPSEQIVGDALDEVIGKAPGRVMVATFASLISRIQQVMDAAANHGRRVGVVGRSMVNNVKMALDMGYLADSHNVLVPLRTLRKLPHEQVVILTTGSQGEPTSALVRIANKDHRDIRIIPGDTVVLSATAIPGNEKLVSRTIDNLFRQGARVLYDKVALVHVHGHASQEELKMMLNLTRPKFFVPIHGEVRHLVAHAQLAQDLGIGSKNTFVLEDGDILELTGEGGQLIEKIPSRRIYVDGLHVWDAESDVIQDRRALSRDGVVVVTMALEQDTGRVIKRPEVVASGFLDIGSHSNLLDSIADVAMETINHGGLGQPPDQDDVTTRVKDALSDFIYKETRLRPLIIAAPVVV